METKRNEDVAAEMFNNGFRCSQAVLEPFAATFGLDVDLARRLSIGFAGGAGCGGVCGAVAAAYLVNSLRSGFSHPGDSQRFQAVIAKNREFAERFRAVHGSLDCRDLIGVDPFSEEGFAYFQEKELKKSICTPAVRDAVRILEALGEEAIDPAE